MSQIIRELADLYPTLNKAEQQRLLYLAAGSRQSSRFAKVMTEFRQAQILAAEAGFDTTASVRENEKILASLQSRIDSVKASWTQFAVALGDAGAMERAGETMRYLRQLVMEFSDSIDEATKKSRELVVNNPVQAEAVERFGGGKNTMFGTRENFSKAEVAQAIKKLEEGIAYQQGNNPLKLLDRYADGSFDISESVFGETKSFKSIGDAEKFVGELKALLEGGGDTGFKDELAAISKEVNVLRENLGAMDRSAGVFDSLAKGFSNGGEDRKTLLRDWQAAAHLLLELENGTNVYASSVQKFNDILATGDAGKMQEFLEGLGKMFSDQGKPTGDKLAAEIGKAIPALDAKLAKLKAERDAIMEKPSADTTVGRAEKQSALDDNLAKTKEVKSQIEQINQAVELSTETAFGTVASSKINNYLDDVQAAAKAFGEAFKDFAPDAENDPVDRIMQRHRRMLELGREALGRVQEETSATSGSKRSAAGFQIALIQGDRVNGTIGDKQMQDQIAAQQKIIDQQNEADVIVKARIEEEEERLQQLQRELEIESAILALKRQESYGGKSAAFSSLAWRFGETESDQDANQAAAAIERANRNLGNAGGTPAANAVTRGQVLQDEATARGALDAMQRRNYEIDAARRQIAYDTLKAMKEQTDEASKRFQMAGREDQLRAAALARTIRDKGPVGQNEFAMLGQNSRQGLVNFLPNDAPGNLNEAKAKADKTRRELDEEQGRLKGTIDSLSTALDGLAARITGETGKGGALDPMAGVPKTQPIQDAAVSRDKNPVVNVDIGAINLQIKLADQLSGMLNTYVDQRLGNELKAMEARLKQQMIPNPQGSVE
jgi:hypothetical protein